MLNVVKCFPNVTFTYILCEGEILIVSFLLFYVLLQLYEFIFYSSELETWW